MSAPRPQQLPERLKDYVFVNERVAEFHDRFPDGRIVTEMSLVEGMVCFKALIYRLPDDAEPAATGHAIDSIDLKQSTFEKVETAAVGRALAFLNFSAKRGIASREEIEKAERHQARPQAVPSSAPRQATGDKPASEQQKADILTLLEDARPGDRRAQRRVLVELTGKESRDDLTQVEAVNLIKKLQEQH